MAIFEKVINGAKTINNMNKLKNLGELVVENKLFSGATAAGAMATDDIEDGIEMASEMATEEGANIFIEVLSCFFE